MTTAEKKMARASVFMLAAFFIVTLVPPAFGAWYLVSTGNAGWLLLMLPLLAYLEGGFALAIIFVIVAAVVHAFVG